MKHLHIVAAMEGVNGVSSACAFLSRMQQRNGDEVTIATLVSDGVHDTANARIVVFNPSLSKSLYFSWQMLMGLKRLVREADVVWVHSSWTFPVWYGSFLSKQCGKKLVIIPHGCFDPIRIEKSKLKKRLVSSIDKWCLRQADCVRATSKAEVGWIKNFEPRVRCVKESPLGVDIPEKIIEPLEHKGLKLLYLGRIHYLKGIDLIIEAMRKLTSKDISFTIAGVEEDATIAKLGDVSELKIKFLPAVFGDDKARLIAEHDCLVLPSRSENYGIVVAEALAQARPVIVSTATIWSDVQTHNCGWYIDPSLDALVKAIEECSSVSASVRKEMGLRGYKLISNKFSWKKLIGCWS